MFSQGRLPYQVKNFVKYIRLATNTPTPCTLENQSTTVFFTTRDTDSKLLTAEPGAIGLYHHRYLTKTPIQCVRYNSFVPYLKTKQDSILIK
jgi:hypothetical protein